MTETPKPAPVRTACIELDGDYAGWWATVRTNLKIRTFKELIAGDLDRSTKALSQILLAWNFVDEQGQPLPSPADPAAIEELTGEQVKLVVDKYVELVNKVPPA